MVSNAYKTQTRLSDPAIAHMLIAGFTGQLKGWWDNYLSLFQQNEILTSFKTDESGEIIWDANNEDIPDAVATLVFAISQHFVGDPSHLKDKNLELLSNLKYYSSASEEGLQMDELDWSSDEKSLNVLTGDQEFLLEIAEQIDNPLLRKQYLEKLKQGTLEGEIKTPNYNLSEIFKRNMDFPWFDQVDESSSSRNKTHKHQDLPLPHKKRFCIKSSLTA
ncbi:hypothetical protein CRG98_019683 [Punica granatum]|uniref:DUF7746 domain-containing protein n=1 Tax=Punica granatum TaxID=22663 RepID=A0A2I0JVJ7_PUNGR|nr:hypothetical protein CRG98_019683 [Punica granatum]